ncbi:MAG: hypothetical protein AB7U62_05330 [Pseudolabrys sp.]
MLLFYRPLWLTARPDGRLWGGRERLMSLVLPAIAGSGNSVMPVLVSPARSPVLWIAIAVGTSLFAAAALLWGYYGTALFFETLRAGLAACF